MCSIREFMNETNAHPFTGLHYIGQYIINTCIYIFKTIQLFIKIHWNIPDKVNCNGFTLSTTVCHVRPLLETIAKAPKLISWLNGIQLSSVRVENIEVMDADFFGPTTNPNRLGFLKIKCTAFSPTNLPVDGIVLIRGHCAVVCTIIENDNAEEFVLTTEQFRMPVKTHIEEFLAGMCDEHEIEDASGSLTKKMEPVLNAILIKELKEEVGLELSPNDPNLKYMGDIMLSPGLLDEKAKMFVWHTKLSNIQIEEMLAKEHGEKGTNERIKPTKNLIRPADSHSSWSMTDKEINPSPEGADLNLQQFKLHLYPIADFAKELSRIGDAKTEVAFFRSLNYTSPFEKAREDQLSKQFSNITIRKKPRPCARLDDYYEHIHNNPDVVPRRLLQECAYEDMEIDPA